MKVLMIVNTSFRTDARVQRCYDALSEKYKVILMDVCHYGEVSENPSGKSIVVKGKDMSGIRWAVQYTWEIVKTAKNIDFDILYVHDYYSALAGLIISTTHKCPIIYDAHEIAFPLHGTRFTLRKRLFYWIEKRLIYKARIIACASRDRALLMMGHYCLKCMPICIRNIAQQDDFGLDATYSKKENEKLRIIYAGVLKEGRSLLELCESIMKSDLGGKIEFHIYGTGVLESKIRALADQDRYSFVKLHGRYDNKQLPNITREYDVGFLAYPNNTINNQFCSPNKIYDYAFQGLPVLANANYTLIEAISKYGIGCCTDNFVAGLHDIMANFDAYRQNTVKFRESNSWRTDFDALLGEMDRFTLNASVKA